MLKELTKIKALLQSEEYGKKISVAGWVRTKRESKNVAFIAMNDGSTIKNIQVVADRNDIADEILMRINTGAALLVKGELVQSQGSGQNVRNQ